MAAAVLTAAATDGAVALGPPFPLEDDLAEAGGTTGGNGSNGGNGGSGFVPVYVSTEWSSAGSVGGGRELIPVGNGWLLDGEGAVLGTAPADPLD